jgi:hypothetical protein
VKLLSSFQSPFGVRHHHLRLFGLSLAGGQGRHGIVKIRARLFHVRFLDDHIRLGHSHFRIRLLDFGFENPGVYPRDDLPRVYFRVEVCEQFPDLAGDLRPTWP